MILLTLVFASLAAVSAPVSEAPAPWGYNAHRIICSIAYRNLNPGAREAVDELLSGEPEEKFRDFRESCTWPDHVRDTRVAEYDTFRTAHYVNLPRRSDGFDLDRDCAGTFCLIEAILEQKAVLEDSRASVDARRDALKFVSHFVGDVHQPLHVGYADDRGGNSVRVLIDGENRSLHSFWDTGFLFVNDDEWQLVARNLGSDIRAIDRTVWKSTDVTDWANESFRIVEDHVYLFPISPQVEDEYYFRNIHTIEEQLKKAGLRLAHLLNSVL